MRILLYLLAFGFFQIVNAQDCLILQDGKMLIGKIESQNKDTILFRELTGENQIEYYLLKEIKEIRFNTQMVDPKAKKWFSNVDYKRAKNAVSLGLGGNNLLIGLQYDRILIEKKSYFFSAGFGIGSLLTQVNINTTAAFHYNFNKSKHHLELGLGASYALNQQNTFFTYYLTAPIVGYKYQPNQDGFYFRSYLCLLTLPTGGSNFLSIPFAGFNFGMAF